MSEQTLVVEALTEAVELLQEENARLRNNNRVLRVVNSALREKLAIANKNDEEFKSLCQSDDVVETDDSPSRGALDSTAFGSYPASVADATGTSYEVESLNGQIVDLNYDEESQTWR